MRKCVVNPNWWVGGQLFHPGFSLTPTKKCFLSRGNFCRVRELPSPGAFGPTSAAVTLRYILPALCDISVAAFPTPKEAPFNPFSLTFRTQVILLQSQLADPLSSASAFAFVQQLLPLLVQKERLN